MSVIQSFLKKQIYFSEQVSKRERREETKRKEKKKKKIEKRKRGLIQTKQKNPWCLSPFYVPGTVLSADLWPCEVDTIIIPTLQVK